MHPDQGCCEFPTLLQAPHAHGRRPNHHFSERACSVMLLVSHLRSWALLCFHAEAAAAFCKKWLLAQVTTVDEGFCLVSIHRLMPEHGIKLNYLILSLLLWQHFLLLFFIPILSEENIVGKEMTEISVEKGWRVVGRWLYFQLVWAGSEISSAGFIHSSWKMELWEKTKKIREINHHHKLFRLLPQRILKVSFLLIPFSLVLLNWTSSHICYLKYPKEPGHVFRFCSWGKKRPEGRCACFHMLIQSLQLVMVNVKIP